jgi:tetratricopeptide (TPR) repeat protein
MAERSVVYRQRITYCGKPGCRPCQEGRGHGPYWYAYQTINGRTKQTYVGKVLPPGVEAEAVTPAALVRLSVLGQMRLERRTLGSEGEWYPVREWHAPLKTLLGALVSSPARSLPLSQVRELLGSKASTADVERAIERLQHLLEPPRRANQQRVVMTRLVEVAPDSLSLADQSRLWVDADAFEALVREARQASQPSEQERLLSEAVALYRGNYWPASSGREATWAAPRRQELHRLWLGLLLDLADLHRARDDEEGAIPLLDQLLTADPTNEAAVQRALLLLARAGRRGEALRFYQRFVAALSQEDHLVPAPETSRLYEAIRSGETLPLPSPVTDSPPLVRTETRAVVPVGRSNQSRLVGRDQELATLHHLLSDTEQRHQLTQACALLTGEAGIGKTRLVEELGREAASRGWAIAWGRAYAQEAGIPYRLWTEALRKVMLYDPGLRQELARRPFLYQPLLALMPDLEDLLLPGQAAPTPEQEPIRLWEAIRALLLTISERMPLLIVLDDVQWADISSCELLAYLVRQLRGSPALLACTCRESELPPSHPLRAAVRDLEREEALISIAVPPLSDEQIRALVAALPASLVHDIQVRAAGNPFFAEELARGADNAPLDQPPTLPDSITAVLDLRLSRTSDACQRLLMKAAVLGGSFEFGTLRAMESGAGALDEDTLLDLLEEALHAGILIEEGSGTQTAYSFWHPLAVDHLYRRLSAARRASLHRRAADALRAASVGREQESAAAIVYHLENGDGDPASIAAFAELAGDRAYRLSAYLDAERYYRLAVERLPAPAPEDARDERLHLARLYERLGECAMVQGHYEEARKYYGQVLEARSTQADATFDASEAQVQALVWSEIGWAWRDTGEKTQAWQCWTRGEQLLQEAGVRDGPAWASLRYQRGNFCWQEGRYDEAEQAAREALAFFEQQPVPTQGIFQETRIGRTLSGDPTNAGRIHILLAAILATTGQSTTAARHLAAALAIFEQYDQEREIAIVSGNLGDLYLRTADYEQARAHFRRSLRIAERMGDVPIQSVGLGNLGVLAAREGNLLEAERLLRRGLALAERIGDPVYQCLWLDYLALTLAERGAYSEASAHLVRALTLTRSMGIPPCTGFTLVTLGQLRLAQAKAEQETQATRRLLRRARGALLRGLAYEGLEAETSTEGQLALAEVALLSGETTTAEQYARQALAEAHRNESVRQMTRAEGLLGKTSA